MRAKISLIIAGSTLLAACGDGKDFRHTAATHQTQPKAPHQTQLKATPQTEQPLRLADEATVKQHITNGLRLQLSDSQHGFWRGSFVTLEAGTPSAVPAKVDAVADSDGTRAGGYSETNVHVHGVDEADIAKYDGRHWFIAQQPVYSYHDEATSSASIDVVATDAAAPGVEVIASLPLENDWGAVGEMYLVKTGDVTTHVASIRHQWGNIGPYLPGRPMDLQVTVAEPAVLAASSIDVDYWHRPVNSKVQLQTLDVSDPARPTPDWRIEIDGSLIDSRKIGNTLYLITRFDPWLEQLQYEYGDVNARERNEAALADATVEQLMPHYYIGDTKTPLASECYLQADVDEHSGYHHLVNITAIDLTSEAVIGSTCINSGVEAMSMSPSNLYLTGTSYDAESGAQRTVIHKFALTEQGAAYAATGSVSGSLGWASDPAFRMHEAGDYLRIVTSQWNAGLPVHRLSILEHQGNALAQVASLPNDTNPAAIGKPNEDIHSVRFYGDKAYIVTFQRTDPLYAIDLSDPANPYIAGELEIPGFATYMHPLGEDYLFTLGHDADANGRVLGIKAELIRITNGTPEVVNKLVFGGPRSSSEALHNLRALTILQVDQDQARIAFPVDIYAEDPLDWQYSGLQLLQIDGLASAEAQLTDQGVLVTQSSSETLNYPQNFSTTRGVLHDEAVFFTSNKRVWSAFWDSPSTAVSTEPTLNHLPENSPDQD